MPQPGYEQGLTDTTPLKNYIAELTAKLPGATEGYIKDQLKIVISDFFRRSFAWRDIIGPKILLAGTNSISLQGLDPDYRVHSILDIFAGTRRLVPLGLDRRLFWNRSNAAHPMGYWTNPYDIVHFTVDEVTGADENVEDIKFICALAPILDNDTVPTWLYDQFYEAIIFGVLSRCYMEPDKTYTSLTTGRTFRKTFLAEIQNAKTTADKNFTQSTPPWQYPPFAR